VRRELANTIPSIRQALPDQRVAAADRREDGDVPARTARVADGLRDDRRARPHQQGRGLGPARAQDLRGQICRRGRDTDADRDRALVAGERLGERGRAAGPVGRVVGDDRDAVLLGDDVLREAEGDPAVGRSDAEDVAPRRDIDERARALVDDPYRKPGLSGDPVARVDARPLIDHRDGAEPHRLPHVGRALLGGQSAVEHAHGQADAPAADVEPPGLVDLCRRQFRSAPDLQCQHPGARQRHVDHDQRVLGRWRLFAVPAARRRQGEEHREREGARALLPARHRAE
jgi:hypothetical protein